MKKYETIYTEIATAITNETILVGSKLASEKDLSEKYDVSRVTIRNALEQLEKDGYIRKQQGKGSIVIRRNGKSQTVLLILPNVFKYIFSELIEGIETTLREHNISLLIANSYNDQSIERNIIRNHLDKVDAIIFEPAQVNNTKYSSSKTYKKLNDVPTVFINTKIPNFDIPYLVLDDKRNLELVTNYVLSQNVKRILILSKTDDSQGHARHQGIEKVLSQSDINHICVEFNTENEQQKLKDFSFLYFNFKPDCIMFYNDEYAYKFLTNYNINPLHEKILVTGFDNTEYSNGQPYKFISPNHPKRVMGQDAANMIIDMLADKEVESITYAPNIDFNK